MSEVWMNDKRREILLKSAASVLDTGENIELTTLAYVGSVSVKKKVLTAAVAGIATGGLLMVNVKPRTMYIVLTDQRILFFDGNTASGRPGKLTAVLRRELVTTTAPKSGMFGLTQVIQLSIAGEERGLKAVFPKPEKAAGLQFAAALPLSG
jgi:hypothetical protein